jgi:hypothetical protein
MKDFFLHRSIDYRNIPQTLAESSVRVIYLRGFHRSLSFRDEQYYIEGRQTVMHPDGVTGCVNGSEIPGTEMSVFHSQSIN